MVAKSQNTAMKRLVNVLETQITESDTAEYEVGEQRERNYRYYSLSPLGNEQLGRSHYVSPDVLDAVEGKKAIFSETFLSSREVVKFDDCQVPGEAEAKTAYVKKCMTKNKYHAVLRDGWHDAFVAKRMVVLAEWFPEDEEIEMEFPGIPAQAVNQQLQQLAQQRPIVDVDQSEMQVQTMPSMQGPQQIVSGKLTVAVEGGYVKLTLIKPEYYFRDPEATYAEDSQWCSALEELSRGELIDQGFDYDQVMGLTTEYRWRGDEEDSARKRHDSSWTRRQQHNRVDEQELVSYFRTWTWLEATDELLDGLELDFEPPQGIALYLIEWANGEVLVRTEATPDDAPEGTPAPESIAAVSLAEEMPFFEWSEMKISHAENGLCTADVVAHTQKTTSGLKRLVLDNQNMRNSSRNLAKVGVLKNPRDLLDNKIGATIWTTDMAGVMPLPAPELSAMTLPIIAMMKQDSEERSGLSGLAKGMNTDAVKYQNADNMIERLTTAGQRRVTAQARDFANTFYIPLARFIVTLARRNDKSQDQMESRGQQVPVVPSQWKDDDMSMTVATALTPEEGQKAFQGMFMMHQTMTQDPSLATMYGAKQKHAQLDLMYEMMGISDTSTLMLSPSSPEYQQAEQQQQQQAAAQSEEQQRQTAFQESLGQAQVDALMSGDQRAWSEFQWKQTDDTDDNRRQDTTAAADIRQGDRKLDIEASKNNAA
tara:strand:- start:1767 stop:3890 length:2124 start_codon:yes stop_codon:yes gene_type:complete